MSSSSKYKLSETLAKVLLEAETTAKKMKNHNIESYHVLFSFLTFHDGVAYSVLTEAGMKPDTMMNMIRMVFDPETECSRKEIRKYSAKLEKILEDAYQESIRLGSDEIDTGHVLLAMLKNKDSAAFKLISSSKLDIEKIYTDIIRTCGFNQKFAKQDYKAYAEALRTLIENDGLRKQYGIAARERVLNNFTVKQFKNNLIRLIDE